MRECRATAVFSCPLPSSPDSCSACQITAFDLGKPVVDFAISPNNHIWVSLDGERLEDNDISSDDDTRAVRVLQFTDGNVVPDTTVPLCPLITSPSAHRVCLIPRNLELTEYDMPASRYVSAMLGHSCVTHPSFLATDVDLKALDLYASLSSLPKSTEPENDPARRGIADEVENAEVESSTAGSKLGKPRELTQREQARLKNKRAVMAKIQEQEAAKAKIAARKAEPEDERDAKKAKSAETEEHDVEMSDA